MAFKFQHIQYACKIIVTNNQPCLCFIIPMLMKQNTDICDNRIND